MDQTPPSPNSSSSSEQYFDVVSPEELQASGGDSNPSSCPSLPEPARDTEEPSTSGLSSKRGKTVRFSDEVLSSEAGAVTRGLQFKAQRASRTSLQESVSWRLMAYQERYGRGDDPEEECMSTDVNPYAEEEEKLPCSVYSGDAQQAVPGQREVVHSCKSATLETKVCSPAAEDETTSSDSVPPAASGMPVSHSSYEALCGIERHVRNDISLIPDGDKLPPLLLEVREKGKDPVVEEHPSHQQVIMLLLDDNCKVLTFILNANLLVNVSIVTYSSEPCWCFSTNGLHALYQAEMIIILQRLANEKIFPIEILRFFIDVYKNAMQGNIVRSMEIMTLTEGFLGNKEYGGFLFAPPVFLTLHDDVLPDMPFLCGILIHKLEMRWAKALPVRLLLTLGADYNKYPTCVVNFRQRKPLFREIGQTVLNLLIDFKNHQYTLPVVNHTLIYVERGTVCVTIPERRHSELMALLQSCDERVISLAASFNTEADSYFVCMQKKYGLYFTKEFCAPGSHRKVTGASFVVFNAVLKPTSAYLAKFSIVEDGIMVQITAETMERLRHALAHKKDFKIPCGRREAEYLTEYVEVVWVYEDEKPNSGIVSQVDGKLMDHTMKENIFQERTFERRGQILKCTEVYYLPKNRQPLNLAQLEFVRKITTACSHALCPHIRGLKNRGMNKLALRVCVDTDMIEYLAGSGGHLLPYNYMHELDGTLIPVIEREMSDPESLPLRIELLFFIMERLF